MSTDPAEGAIAALTRFFAARPPGVAAAYLFGSTARGTARDTSDVDVAVLFDPAPPHTLDGPHVPLAQKLEALLGQPVDLIVLNHAPADLAHRVLRDGILLCDANPSARIRFEVRARNDYFDLEPVLRRYRRTGGPVNP